MKIIPAIDIRGGKVVRLEQGDAGRETVYSDSPLETAKRWVSAGAAFIHIVDLDGAMGGDFRNLPLIRDMVKKIDAGIELGGGLRSEDAIKDVLDAGVEKAVIGTRAVDEKFLSGIIQKFGDRIVVGIDARNGFVYTKGWLANSGIKAVELAKKMKKIGVRTINYTDISRDGMLEGPNVDSLKEMLKIEGIDIIASGGVSTIEDVKRLKALEDNGLKSMIIGKALYEKTIDLEEAIRVCSQKE